LGAGLADSNDAPAYRAFRARVVDALLAKKAQDPAPPARAVARAAGDLPAR
jgi:hypothetical protein